MRLTVEHSTRYTFSRPLTDVIQLLRLTPLSCLSQTVLDWRLDVQCDARLREHRDGYGNVIHMLYVNQPVTELLITAKGTVITEDRAGVVQGLPGDLPSEVFRRPTPLTQGDAAMQQLASDIRSRTSDSLTFLHDLNTELNRRLRFETDITHSATTAVEAFAAGGGVCQDFSHIFIAVARSAGIPARYVSGHLYRRDGQDRQPASHAWIEAWVTDLGWVAFDPANGVCGDDAYVRVAAGLDYHETAPVVGTRRGGGKETVSVDVRVSQARGQSQSQRQGFGGGRNPAPLF